MPSSSTALCHHRHANGNRCGSPALRGEQFCYFHHPTRRPARRTTVAAPVPFELPPIVDSEDLQVSLSEIMRRVADTTLDPQRANFLLNCLHMASGYIRS